MSKNQTNEKNNISVLNVEEIQSPKDIKSLSVKELEYVAIKIREFLIQKVSKTGGHLASNLGAVELTLGLHYVFDSPRDKIIWDVGHQAYVHKILTGRAGDFDNLRKENGISGFPKKKESPHDFYDTGHSSTSISAALGMASAKKIKKEDGEVIAVIGDGSMTGGPAFEALNNIGNSDTKVIVVLNDNGMSISSNIGGISEHLGRLRTSNKYAEAKRKVKGALDRVPRVGQSIKSVVANTKENIKYLMLPEGVLFEELGITYIGPYDGNDMDDVIEAFKRAKNYDGPVIVHLITKKGKGYVPAEMDPNKFHGIGPFDIETGKTGKESEKSYSQIFGETMVELGEVDDRITAITAAMCDATGLSEFMKKYPERTFDVGIAEAHGIIFAAGLAMEGLHPVVAIYSSFLQRAYDEILEDLCLQNLPVTLAIDRAGIVGADGETHHGIFDISYLLPMPGMTIYTPSDGKQLKLALEAAVKSDSPTAVRYPRGKAKDIPELEGLDDSGMGNHRLYEGKDADLLAVGNMLEHALGAKNILESKGIDCGIINVSCIDKEKGLQDYLIDGSNARLVVTLEDNVLIGGFGEFFTAMASREAKSNYEVLNLGWPDKFIEHGTQGELFSRYGLDAKGVAQAILNKLK